MLTTLACIVLFYYVAQPSELERISDSNLLPLVKVIPTSKQNFVQEKRKIFSTQVLVIC